MPDLRKLFLSGAVLAALGCTSSPAPTAPSPTASLGTFAKNTMSGAWNAISCEPQNIPICGEWSATRAKGP